MFYLPQGYENTEHLLMFSVVDDEGILVDPEAIGFRILDSTGSNVFPVAGYEDVRANEGRLGTGRYWAYDKSVNDQPWTVGGAQAVGVYTIEWQWNLTGGSTQTFSEAFEIVDGTAFTGLPYRTYVSPTQVRDEGVDATTLSDSRLEFLLEVIQSIIEERTRNVFRPVYRTIRFDGPQADRIFLGQPIIGIESLSVRDGATFDNTTLAVAFERADQKHRFRPHPDHRRNPTISLRGDINVFSAGLFTRSIGKFGAGRMNYRLSGVFGFVETDGTVPAMLQDAMLRLVIYAVTTLGDSILGGGTSGGSSGGGGPLKKIKAGGYEIEYNVGDSAGAASSLNEALLQSRIVEEELKQFRAPQAIQTTKPNTAFASVY